LVLPGIKINSCIVLPFALLEWGIGGIRSTVMQ
jgi:hypothetical protein